MIGKNYKKPSRSVLCYVKHNVYVYVLFRAKNALGFFNRCGGHQQDFHPEKRNLTLKEVGECMQCSSKCESELSTGKKNDDAEAIQVR